MDKYEISSISSEIGSKEGARHLGLTFQLILSWDIPEEPSATPKDQSRETHTLKTGTPSEVDAAKSYPKS